jgi:hypothetical protein
VPQDRYDPLISRINEFFRGKREDRAEVYSFLAYRCDQDFLAKFITRNPTFISGLKVMSYFYAVPEIDVINRLHEFGLLPEPERLRHVDAIRNLAVSTPDAGFLNNETVSFTTPDETREILQHARATLLTDLASCIDSWRENHGTDEDPEQYFSHLKAALRDYKKALDQDTEAVQWIETGLERIAGVIADLETQMPDRPDQDEYLGDRAREDSPSSRSIFDDVDK